MWNNAWTVDIINSDIFGVRFQCIKAAGNFGVATECQVDAATMTIYIIRNLLHLSLTLSTLHYWSAIHDISCHDFPFDNR